MRSPVHQAKLWAGELKGDGWVDADWRRRRDKVGEMKGFPCYLPSSGLSSEKGLAFPVGIRHLLGGEALLEAAA